MNLITFKEHPPIPTEFSNITDFLSVGTNMCCGAHSEKLMQLGITADLDLEEDRQELPPHVSAYLWLPVPDHAAPTQAQLALGSAFIGAVAQQGGRVFVHCRAGHGRSPTMAAAYFITRGMTTDEAITRVQQGRPEAHPEPPQVLALRQFEQTRRTH